jgi:hypothetical protein
VNNQQTFIAIVLDSLCAVLEDQIADLGHDSEPVRYLQKLISGIKEATANGTDASDLLIEAWEICSAY